MDQKHKLERMQAGIRATDEPTTKDGSAERAAAMREWRNHEGTKVLLRALWRERDGVESTINGQRLDTSRDILTDENARASLLRNMGSRDGFDFVIEAVQNTGG
jgi:hypothetical protein